MVTTSLYPTLRNTLPKTHLSLVTRSILREPTLLRALENEDFLEMALQQLGKNPSLWTPANLALIKLGTSITPQELRNSPNTPLPAEIRQAAVQTFDRFRHEQGFMLSDLANAGMVALAMRERARILGSWAGLWKELPEKDPHGVGLAFICVYGLIPEPDNFLRSLLQESKNLMLCARIIYAQPFDSDKHARQLAHLSLSVRASDRLALLRHLAVSSPSDASQLAAELRSLESSVSKPDFSPSQPAGNDTADIWQLPNSVYFSELHKHSGDRGTSFDFFQALLKQFSELHQDLLSEYLIEAVRNRRWEIVDHFQKDGKYLEKLSAPSLAKLSLNLWHAQEINRASALLPEPAGHPAVLFMQAILKQQQQLSDEARLLSLTATTYEHFLAETDFEILKIAAELLLQLERPYEAAQIAHYLVRHLPGDPTILILMAQTETVIGSKNEALKYAHLAAAISPENEEAQRQLIRCLEANGRWQDALKEWKSLLNWTPQAVDQGQIRASQFDVDPADVRSAALTAALSGNIEIGLQACWDLLEKLPDDGMTHLTLGKIYALSGEKELALEHQIRANHLAPDRVETWLHLAEAYRQEGNAQQALNLLRTAVQALPEISELHLAMAMLYDEIDQPTEALAACQKAADLDGLIYDPEKYQHSPSGSSAPENAYLSERKGNIAILLGRLFLGLGHPGEAVTILGQAYQTREFREIVAYDFARALLGVHKDRQALSALSLAYQNHQENASLALEYARLLMKLGEQPDIAAQVLQKILGNGSSEPEVLGLLAEALAASQNYQAALVYYQKAMETNLISDVNWAPRLSLGLSHVAIEIGSPNLAIAALQEAIHKAPQHLALQQKLSEACAAASLDEDAVNAAQRALEIAPADVENLLWFARHALRLNAPELAQSALIDAAELSPNNPSLLIQLAQTQNLIGKQVEARENYLKASRFPEITLEQLHVSARGLLELGDPDGAIGCLEKVQLIANGQFSDVNQAMILLLAEAYEAVGQYQTALEMLEQALLRDKGSIQLLKQKARIHKQLGQQNAACACLSQVLSQSPADASAYQMLVDIYASQGELQLALENARLYFDLSAPDDKTSAACTAAKLAWQLFQEHEAEQFLYALQPRSYLEANHEKILQFALLHSLFVISGRKKGDLEEVVNSPALNQLENPGTHALRAVNNILNLELELGEVLLRQALVELNTSKSVDSLAYELIFETACLLANYEMAIEAATSWLSTESENPRALLAVARAYTETAELKHFMLELSVRHHMPNDDASLSEAYGMTRRNLSRALESLGFQVQDKVPTIVTHPMIPPQILQWIIRSEAVFSNQINETGASGMELLDDLSRLEPSPENTAAVVAALRAAGMIEQSIRAAKDYPNNAQVLAQLALSTLQKDSTEAMAAALSALEGAISSKHVHILPAYQALIAMTAHQAEKYSQAYQAISIALTEWPDEEMWHGLAAVLARKLDDLSGSIQHLEKAINLDPENPAFHQDLADIFRTTGSLARAAEALEAVCTLVPDEPENWIHLAEVLIEQGELESAAEKVSRALVIDPENGDYLQFAAELALANREFGHTCQFAGKLLNIDPANATAAYLLAKGLSALNKKHEAIEVLDRAQKYANRPVELYLERIRLVRSLQGIRPAFQSLVALQQQHPDHPGILALLAEYLQEQGQTQEALSTAQKALQLAEPALSQAEKSKLHALMGRILRRTGQLDQAIHQLSQAVSLNTQKIELYLELGKAHQDRRQIQEALAVYQRAIEIAPADPRPYQQAGLALKESKDYLGAEKMIRKAAELAPHDISIHRLLGSLVALNLVHNAQ